MLRSVKLSQVFEYPVLERCWRDADELGFHAVWDYDHFYGMRDPTTPTFDGWSMLASMAVSVDHISSGRLEFGIGAGSHEGEHRGYGIPFPAAGTRIAMLDEACEIIRRLWSEGLVTHHGRFWTLTDALANPKPVQERLPIVIGGTGERKTLRVVARHADEWNYSPMHDLGPEGPAEFARLSGVLDQRCQEIGHDPGEIRRGFQTMVRPDDREQVEATLPLLDEYERAGDEHAVMGFVSPPPRSLLEELSPS